MEKGKMHKRIRFSETNTVLDPCEQISNLLHPYFTTSQNRK